MKGLLGIFLYVCRLPLPHLCLFGCNNGAVFLSGELRCFLGFLSGLTELPGVTVAIMLQRQKYTQSFVIFLLFAMLQTNSQINMLLLGNHCALVIYMFVGLFTVIKYSKTCLKRNLKGPEHFSAEARFLFNQGIL
jgi:hypothetical protein